MSGLQDLRRWQDAGGTWEVVHRTTTSVTVSLCQCDGGQEAARFTSQEPELLDFLAARNRSDDD